MLRRFLRTITLLLGGWSCTLTVLAQEGLPHDLAPHELELIRPYRDTRASTSRGISTPPPFAVRTMAEWEEVESLVLAWTSFPGILKQIVRHAVQECRVIIACEDQAAVQSYLLNSEFGGPITDLSNVTYLVADFNSIWCRDYFAESIYANEVDSLLLLDWIYNRPRPADDLLSDAVAGAEGLVVYSTTNAPYDLVHTGGNFMSDGAGTAFSSELVLEENGAGGEYNQTIRDEAGVDEIMQQFMGIERYIKMTVLPYDGISHIDMHMKLLDEETLLVGEFPVGLSDGPQLEMNLAAIMANEVSTFGDPYRLVRVPMPSSTAGNFPPNASYRTFTNNIFINGTVLVPTYRTEYDTVGLRILREELPGYEVVGIDCDSEQNIIAQSGAIHCITKTIGVRDPLLIRHQRLLDTENTVEPYLVEAYVRHRSGISSATLHWSIIPDGPFQAVPMNDAGAGIWQGIIPAQSAGTLVHYYVEAESNSGKVQVRPIVAPEGWWRFRVLGPATGIEEWTGEVFTEVYPNPTTSIVAIQVAMDRSLPVRIELLDALGRSVAVIHNGALPADGRVFADLAALPEAPYLVVVSAGGSRATKVLVKQ